MTERDGRLSGDEARSRLYEVMRSDESMETRIRRALEIGVDYFGVEHAYVSEVDPESDDWGVTITLDDDERMLEGMEAPLSTTHCRRIIEQEGVVAFHDAGEEGLEDDVAVETYGLRCYHGAPVLVDGDVYGTVCFSSEEARGDPFTDAEKAFTDLVAKMVSHEIEREQRKAQLDERERELEERREVYRAVIDASFDMVFRFDTDGVYTYHSPGSEELLRYAPEDLLGEPYTKLLPDDETAELARDLFERVRAGETVEETYLPLETADGSLVYADVRVTPVYDAGVPEAERTPEDIVALQGTARDATERKRRERLTRVLNRVLRHNLRNEMSILKGHADLLADEVGDHELTHVDQIRETADRLLTLGETARDLEENFEQRPTLQPTDVVAVVERLARQADGRYDDVTVSVDAPDRAIAVTADRLEPALWELLDNAAKHAGEEPTISVAVSVTADRVEITVADDGPGLPEDEAAVLSTGEETPLVHGSGLGLWLVYWITSSLGGEVRVPDDAAGGRVVVDLPRASD